MSEWRDIETAPKGAHQVDLLIKSDISEYVVRDCVWLAPVDTDAEGNEFYCYEEAGWWSNTDDDESEPDWAEYGSAKAIAWRPGRVKW